jgi:hypothetical protein
MEISKIVDDVVGIYKPGYRYLKSAKISFGKKVVCNGEFKLGITEYMEDLGHMTDVEAQLCLNQICYVFLLKRF